MRILLLLLFPTILQAQSLVLQNINVIDIINKQLVNGQDVLINEGKIMQIGPANMLKGDSTIDLSGKFLIPGLIDSHTHIEHSGYGTNYNPPRENLVELLSHAVHGGLTGIREMACDARVMVELSRSAKLDLIASPDIYFPSLLAGPAFFKDPRSQAIALGTTGGEVSWARAIGEDPNYGTIISEAKGNGSHALKLYALLTPEQVMQIKMEAERQGLAVWSHAYLQQTKPSTLIDLKLESLSHAPLLLYESESKPDFSQYPENDQFLVNLFRNMKANDVALDPTLFVYNSPRRATSTLETSKKITRNAHINGVRIVAGTDSISAYRTHPLPFIHNEIATYVECGFSPVEALQTATINAAKMLNIDDTHGSVDEGKQANLIVLNGNPMEDIAKTREIHMVLKNGRLFKK